MKKNLQILFIFFNTQPYNSFVKRKMLIFLSSILKVICIHSHLAHGQGFSSKGKNLSDIPLSSIEMLFFSTNADLIEFPWILDSHPFFPILY